MPRQGWLPNFSLRKVWRLKYRVYSILVIFLLIFILYSDTPTAAVSVISETDFKVANALISTPLPKQGLAKNEQLNIAKIVYRGTQKLFYDIKGQLLPVDENDSNYNLGFITNSPFVDLSNQTQNSQNAVQEVTLNDIIPIPSNPEKKNFLIYPEYNVNVPIQYTSWEDLFEKNADGSIDYRRPRDTSRTDSPLQVKLQQGIVHMVNTPLPGEIGNSYIVGHSSNYSYIKSAYNEVFKPLEHRSQPGQEFVIYDQTGRLLKFRVFETIEIAAEDTATAYKTFDNKRVVTLQTSVLKCSARGCVPSHRWLTRGELIVNE